MERVSKELAERMKETLSDYFKYLPETQSADIRQVFVSPVDVENMIDRFTEKEFPGFDLSDTSGDRLIIFNDGIGDRVRIDVNGQQVWVHYSRFKEIADAANAIQAWINEQYNP